MKYRRQKLYFCAQKYLKTVHFFKIQQTNRGEKEVDKNEERWKH